jgi:hypothetical protein
MFVGTERNNNQKCEVEKSFADAEVKPPRTGWVASTTMSGREGQIVKGGG